MSEGSRCRHGILRRIAPMCPSCWAEAVNAQTEVPPPSLFNASQWLLDFVRHNLIARDGHDDIHAETIKEYLLDVVRAARTSGPACDVAMAPQIRRLQAERDRYRVALEFIEQVADTRDPTENTYHPITDGRALRGRTRNG